jgi:hypothetical protein
MQSSKLKKSRLADAEAMFLPFMTVIVHDRYEVVLAATFPFPQPPLLYFKSCLHFNFCDVIPSILRTRAGTLQYWYRLRTNSINAEG